MAFAPLCSGDTLHFVVTGEYDSSAPTTTLTAPDTDFSIVFDTSSTPTPYASESNQSDFILPDTAIYTLGGNTVICNPATASGPFFTPSEGGINFILRDSASNEVALYFWGPQIFTGMTSAPDLIYAMYSPNPAIYGYFTAGVSGATASGDILNSLVTNVPEPSSFALLSIGFFVPILRRRFQLRRRPR